MTDLRLSKLHATGNDFLVQLGLDPDEPELDVVVVSALCDRHRGIGADGLITIGPGRDGADCSMSLVNADGGRAEMSGNGIRCLAWVAASAGLLRGDELVVDTAAGRRQVSVERNSWGDVIAAEVDLGAITFDPAAIPVDVLSPFDLEAVVAGTVYRGDAAGIGNPHFVSLVDDPAAVPVTVHGPRLEHDPRFPRRTNAEFVAVTGTDRLAMRVWERGVGETQSCGTGACASAAVAHRRGLVGERVRVDVLGGSLAVSLGPTVRLGGPVVHVFDVVMPREPLLESLARPTG
jgi:diaminopimelate epimerase